MHEERTPLGKTTQYPQRYDPSLLCPLPRTTGRNALNLSVALPFSGVDLWTAYEISWLDKLGKPQVAIGEFAIACDSEFLIESKSLKLYLNSLNQQCFADSSEIEATITEDLRVACAGDVVVRLFTLSDYQRRGGGSFSGICLDNLVVTCTDYQPNVNLLEVCGETVQSETLYSDLLKSNCPATGQPDWASIQISYRGKAIDHGGLLRYIVSFRNHAGFHEHCVEQIFIDIQRRCQPQELIVYARYTRRGGIDINPLRTTDDYTLAAGLLGSGARQVRQ